MGGVFVLIMTMTHLGNPSNAITAVEFNSKQACVNAGEAWVKLDKPRYVEKTYICAAK